MKRLIPFAIAAAPLAYSLFVAQTTNPSVLNHVKTLQNAKAVHIEFTVQPIGEATTANTLQLSFPNMLKWETPDKSIYMNGKTIWTYDKVKKTYSEETVSPNWTTMTLNSGPAWMWSAFTDAKFPEQIGSVKAGKKRKLRGVDITELEVTLSKKGNSAATLLFDDKLGVIRGAIMKEIVNGAPKETLILAEKMEILTEAIKPETFAFVPPAGASKVEAAAATDVKWAEVSNILLANCSGCHGAGMRRAGVDLSSYAGVMQGGNSGPIIVAGNPEASRILMHMRGQRRVMPPSGRLPESVVGKIEAWIKSGAKED